jgi:MoaA/NifB/PqqE/SkfB family radical SAM enzyme
MSDFLEVLEDVFVKEVNLVEEGDSFPRDFFENLQTSKYPGMVQVGISNSCDLACQQCYHRTFKKNFGYKPTFMDVSVFKRIIDETATFSETKALRFLGKGEALLHPNLIEILSYARANLNIPIVLITNGIKLNSEMARRIFETEIDVLDISIDANSSEVYGTVRSHPEKFHMLTRNVERLIELKRRCGFKTKIFISFLVQPENYHEVYDFKARWQGKVDKILYRKYHTYSGKLERKPTPYRDRIPCAALWSRLNINEKGLITRCFVDWGDKHILADFNDRKVTLLDTWRGQVYKCVRQQHLTKKFSGICKKCEGWQTAHWNISYEKAIEMTGGK